MFKTIAATAATALAVSLKDCQHCYLNEMQEQNDKYYDKQVEELTELIEEDAEETASGLLLSINWSGSTTVNDEVVSTTEGSTDVTVVPAGTEITENADAEVVPVSDAVQDPETEALVDEAVEEAAITTVAETVEADLADEIAASGVDEAVVDEIIQEAATNAVEEAI